MRKVYIYGLTDPRNNEIRYIGKTVQPIKRLKHHIYLAKTFRDDTYKARWIRTILSEGVEPKLIILTTTDEANWDQVEREWIAKHKHLQLTNTTAGGEGVDAPRTEIWRKRIGDAHRGKKLTPEQRQHLSDVNRTSQCKQGHPWTEENTKYAYQGERKYRFCGICATHHARLRRQRNYIPKPKPSHCKRGHLLSEDNLQISIKIRRGKSYQMHCCRQCIRIRNRNAKKTTLKNALNRDEPPIHKGSQCKHGHEYTPENTGYTKHGYRFCKTCERGYRKHKQRK